MGPLATCLTEEVCIQHCVSATHCSLSPLSNRPSVKQSSTFSDMTLKSSSHEMLEASDAASEAARPAGFRALATSGHQERVPTKSARTPEAPSKSSQRGSSSVESLAKLGSCGAAIGLDVHGASRNNAGKPENQRCPGACNCVIQYHCAHACFSVFLVVQPMEHRSTDCQFAGLLAMSPNRVFETTTQVPGCRHHHHQVRLRNGGQTRGAERNACPARHRNAAITIYHAWHWSA